MFFRLSIVLKHFTKQFIGNNLVFTAVGIFTYVMYGPAAIAPIFWTKIIGYTAILAYLHYYRPRTYLFFHTYISHEFN